MAVCLFPGENMTENKTYDLASLAAIVEEQKAVIVSMSAKLNEYGAKLNEYEKLRAASAAPAAAPAAAGEKAEVPVSPQDAAYQAVLKEMGLSKED